MPSITEQHSFHGEINDVFTAISTYSKYPDYLPGVQKIEVLPAKTAGSTCQVRYELNLIKTFYYVLNMYATEPHKIWWDMDDSNIMKSNSGSWELKALKPDKKGVAKTKATYTLDLNFKGFVPGFVTDQIAKANLPTMFEGFQKMVDEVKG